MVNVWWGTLCLQTATNNTGKKNSTFTFCCHFSSSPNVWWGTFCLSPARNRVEFLPKISGALIKTYLDWLTPILLGWSWAPLRRDTPCSRVSSIMWQTPRTKKFFFSSFKLNSPQMTCFNLFPFCCPPQSHSWCLTWTVIFKLFHISSSCYFIIHWNQNLKWPTNIFSNFRFSTNHFTDSPF